MKKEFLTFCFSICLLTTSAQSVIQMTKQAGVYVVPCTVNGLKMSFIFDTGASDVSLSLTEALFMYKNGYIDSSDFIGTRKFVDATGKVGEGYKLNLREIEFGGYKISNVEATVVKNADAPLLMGQSLLQKLGSVEVDFVNGNLKILKSNATQGEGYNTSIKTEQAFPASALKRNEYLKCFQLINEITVDTLESNYRESVLEKALSLYEQNLDLQQDDSLAYELFFSLGMTYFWNQETRTKSYEALTKAIKCDKINKGRALLMRGMLNYDLENYNEAIEDLTLVLISPGRKIDSEDIRNAINYRLNCNRKLSNYSEMIKDYNLLLKRASSAKERCHIYKERGEIKYQLGDYLGASKDLDIAIVSIHTVPSSEQYEFYFTRSYIRYELKQFTNALSDINTALRLNKNCSSCYYNRGFIKKSMRDKNGACTDWSMAGELGFEEAYRAIRENCN